MKKMILVALVALMAAPVVVSCGEKKADAKKPAASVAAKAASVAAKPAAK